MAYTGITGWKQRIHECCPGLQVKETSRVGSFKRPQKPIELYEYETCPFCRRVSRPAGQGCLVLRPVLGCATCMQCKAVLSWRLVLACAPCGTLYCWRGPSLGGTSFYSACGEVRCCAGRSPPGKPSACCWWVVNTRLDIIVIPLHLALGGVSPQSCLSQRQPQRLPGNTVHVDLLLGRAAPLLSSGSAGPAETGRNTLGSAIQRGSGSPIVLQSLRPSYNQLACLMSQIDNPVAVLRIQGQACPLVLQVREFAAAKAAATQACLHPASPDSALLVLQVREAVAVLDLEVLYRPCPANGPMWRAKAREMGGKASFPFMYDPNTGMPLNLKFQSI